MFFKILMPFSITSLLRSSITWYQSQPPPVFLPKKSLLSKPRDEGLVAINLRKSLACALTSQKHRRS